MGRGQHGARTPARPAAAPSQAWASALCPPPTLLPLEICPPTFSTPRPIASHCLASHHCFSCARCACPRHVHASDLTLACAPMRQTGLMHLLAWRRLFQSSSAPVPLHDSVACAALQCKAEPIWSSRRRCQIWAGYASTTVGSPSQPSCPRCPRPLMAWAPHDRLGPWMPTPVRSSLFISPAQAHTAALLLLPTRATTTWLSVE